MFLTTYKLVVDNLFLEMQRRPETLQAKGVVSLKR
jgi:hypothetical protein